jgi:predicted AAA+ superfamily ATPase
MKRRIELWLARWRDKPDRDVLLVRGARQVGKTYSIRGLAKSFDNFLEVNFEEDVDVHSFFEGNLTPAPICENLAAYYRVPIIPGKTLLFFDEIQACPRALSSLRFFREKMPDLHVVASGSLLEFAMDEIPSQGVGRISSLFMYPMSFSEFLEAVGEAPLNALIEKAGVGSPLDAAFHRKLVGLLRTFQLIGGMPRVVQTYVSRHDLNECMELLDSLLVILRDDFAKYKRRAPVSRLVDVHNSVFSQAGSKFMYSRIESNCSTAPLKASMDMLIKSGLAIKVTHSSARGLPLASQSKPSKFKLLPSDTGLMQRAMGLDLSQLLVADDVEIVNRGGLAEVFVGLELVRSASPLTQPSLHYWHRESRGSSAELDYVIQHDNMVLPIEVKAGSSGKMRSMHMFLKERSLPRGIRMSLENVSAYGNIDTLPLYCACLFHA